MKHTNPRFFLPVFLTLFALIFTGMVVVIQWNNPLWQLGIGLGLALGIALFTTYFLAQKIGTTERYMAQFESEFSELSISNERFEIVSKATSDTIWDWDVKNQQFYLEQRNSRRFWV